MTDCQKNIDTPINTPNPEGKKLEDDPSKKKKTFEDKIRILLHAHLNLKDSKWSHECKHEGGCLLNIIVKVLKGFILGFGIKSCANFIGVLFNLKKLLKNPMLVLSIFKDSVRFGCFPGVFNLVLQSTLCFQKQKQIRPEIRNFISGFLAGFLSLATRQKKDRSIWGIFLMSRGIECIYNSLGNKGYIKKRPTDYTLLFCVAMSFIGGICYAYEPLCLPHGLNKFYKLVCSERLIELDFRKCWIETRNNKLALFGAPRQDPMEAMLLMTKKMRSK